MRYCSSYQKKKVFYHVLLGIVVIAASNQAAPAARAQQGKAPENGQMFDEPVRDIVGWVEKVRVYPPDVLLHAKLDTGADFSSLHAEKIDGFEKESAPWVRFTVKNRYGVKKRLEYPVYRIARIKRHGGKVQERFVIKLSLCLGGHVMEDEVNLVNRRHFDYQMLVGRSFLSNRFLINPSQTYTVSPRCDIKTDGKKTEQRPEPAPEKPEPRQEISTSSTKGVITSESSVQDLKPKKSKMITVKGNPAPAKTTNAPATEKEPS